MHERLKLYTQEETAATPDDWRAREAERDEIPIGEWRNDSEPRRVVVCKITTAGPRYAILNWTTAGDMVKPGTEYTGAADDPFACAWNDLKIDVHFFKIVEKAKATKDYDRFVDWIFEMTARDGAAANIPWRTATEYRNTLWAGQVWETARDEHIHRELVEDKGRPIGDFASAAYAFASATSKAAETMTAELKNSLAAIDPLDDENISQTVHDVYAKFWTLSHTLLQEVYRARRSPPDALRHLTLPTQALSRLQDPTYTLAEVERKKAARLAADALDSLPEEAAKNTEGRDDEANPDDLE
jgi:hypothetical protein